MSKAIETAIKNARWKEARRLVRARLKKKPDSHWLLTRLGSTYYEERSYRTALSYTQRALKLTPQCPLALWDYAGSLQMLGRHRSALRVYRRLVSRGVEDIAWGDCGEGRGWARGLIADCFYRQAQSYEAIKKPKTAVSSYRKHLKLRGPGCMSIYPIRAVRKELAELA